MKSRGYGCLLGLGLLLANPLDDLIGTEQQFARKALDSSVKEAFEQYMAPDAVLFSDGKPVRGTAYYASMPADKQAELTWYPAYGRVTSSGDMGWTAGPYTYRVHRGGSLSSQGYFFSVWRRAGESFRLLLDAGVTHGKGFKTALEKEKPFYKGTPGSLPVFIRSHEPTPGKAFGQLQKMAMGQPGRGYRQHMSDSLLFIRPNQQLIRDQKSLRSYFHRSLYKECRFEVLGSGASAGGEVYYYYGRATWMHVEPTAAAENGYFVQLWRQERYGWKMVADVFQPDSP